MSIADRLKGLVSVVQPQYEEGDKKAVVIAISSQKGGGGKTTTAVNLGSALCQFHQKKVLVIDLDPQGHVEKALGALIHDGLEYTPLSKVLTAKRGNILDAVIRTEMENLHITPGDHDLIEAEVILGSRIGKEFIMQQALATARTHYDYVLFDCPPSLGNLTLNALVASDYVLLPCEMSVLAFEGVSDLLDTLQEVGEKLNQKLQVMGVLFTRYDGRNITMNSLIIDNMRKYFNGKIFKTSIAVNTAINKSQLDGRPIFQYAPSSSGSQNYQSLATEVVQRIKKRPATKYQRLAKSA